MAEIDRRDVAESCPRVGRDASRTSRRARAGVACRGDGVAVARAAAAARHKVDGLARLVHHVHGGEARLQRGETNVGRRVSNAFVGWPRFGVLFGKLCARRAVRIRVCQQCEVKFHLNTTFQEPVVELFNLNFFWPKTDICASE